MSVMLLWLKADTVIKSYTLSKYSSSGKTVDSTNSRRHAANAQKCWMKYNFKRDESLSSKEIKGGRMQGEKRGR